MLGDGHAYDNGGYLPIGKSLLRNDTGEVLPLSEAHRLTPVVRVKLEAGEYIVPAHLVAKLLPISEDDA